MTWNDTVDDHDVLPHFITPATLLEHHKSNYLVDPLPSSAYGFVYVMVP